MRNLAPYEARALHRMATAQYRTGSPPEHIEIHCTSYLIARGWSDAPAQYRAREAVDHAVREVDSTSERPEPYGLGYMQGRGAS